MNLATLLDVRREHEGVAQDFSPAHIQTIQGAKCVIVHTSPAAAVVYSQ